jgi:hypothetical protein
MVNTENGPALASNRLIIELRQAWTDSAPLTVTCILMAAALVASCVGIFLDPRIITGVPAWLKPAKFAVSTAIFSGTIAWLFRYITIWPRFMRAIGWILSIVLVFEVAIIDLQAARGTSSHFNAATSRDAALFAVMGVAIGFLWLASMAVLIALFRQKFQNPAWGWLLRLGMLTTVLGSAGGGLMLRMTPEQAANIRATHQVRAVGGHTVGAPDGGPGLPGVGWSTQHGDLRVPHFFGLHGVQIIPFIGWLLISRRRIQDPRRQTRFAFALAASYLAWIGILAWQALRGQSIIDWDGATLTAVAIWFAAVAAAMFFTLRVSGDSNTATRSATAA